MIAQHVRPSTNLAFLAALLAAGITAAPAYAESVTKRSLRVIDGDTVMIERERVRLLDIDAPEISGSRCAAERTRGSAAKQWLGALIRHAGSLQLVRSGEHDRYGRTLGRLIVDGKDAGEQMIKAGIAIEWTPGRASWERRMRHWCG